MNTQETDMAAHGRPTGRRADGTAALFSAQLIGILLMATGTSSGRGLAMSDVIVAAIIGAVALLAGAVITGIFQLVGGRQQNRVARRQRLGPRLRELVGICKDVRGTAYGLQNNPAMEVNVNAGAIQRYRQRLDQIVEPDLKKLHKEVENVLTSLTTWWGRAHAVVQMDAQGQNVNPKIRDAIDDLGEKVQANIQRVEADLEMALKKLEG